MQFLNKLIHFFYERADFLRCFNASVDVSLRDCSLNLFLSYNYFSLLVVVVVVFL